MGSPERDHYWCQYSAEAISSASGNPTQSFPMSTSQQDGVLPACHQAGDPWGVAPLGPSCHRCASAVLAKVPAPPRSELCQQMSCCQSHWRSQSTAPQRLKLPPKAAATRGCGQTCHRLQWATPRGRMSAGIKDARVAASEVESTRVWLGVSRAVESASLSRPQRRSGHSV